MIKFNCLIHKETGEVIKYDYWVNRHDERQAIDTKETTKYYYPKEMLFSNDFEIIYDSEFTVEELQKILKDNLDNVILYKLVKNIDSKKYLNFKYGIEV